jgi:hypothetical protein
MPAPSPSSLAEFPLIVVLVSVTHPVDLTAPPEPSLSWPPVAFPVKVLLETESDPDA